MWMRAPFRSASRARSCGLLSHREIRSRIAQVTPTDAAVGSGLGWSVLSRPLGMGAVLFAKSGGLGHRQFLFRFLRARFPPKVNASMHEAQAAHETAPVGSPQFQHIRFIQPPPRPCCHRHSPTIPTYSLPDRLGAVALASSLITSDEVEWVELRWKVLVEGSVVIVRTDLEHDEHEAVLRL